MIIYPFSNKQVKNIVLKNKKKENNLYYNNYCLEKLLEIKPATFDSNSIQPIIELFQLEFDIRESKYHIGNKIFIKLSNRLIEPVIDVNLIRKNDFSKYKDLYDIYHINLIIDKFIELFDKYLKEKYYVRYVKDDYFIIHFTDGKSFNYEELIISDDIIQLNSNKYNKPSKLKYRDIKLFLLRNSSIITKKEIMDKIIRKSDEMVNRFLSRLHIKVENKKEIKFKNKITFEYINYINKWKNY